MKIFLSIALLVISIATSVDGSSTVADERSFPNIFITSDVSYTDLANGGSFTLYAATSPGSTYRILSVATVASGCTNFTGGDRSIYIGTVNEKKWLFPNNILSDVGSISLIRTSDGIGIHPSLDSMAISDTNSGDDIIIRYYDGNTDHTSGSLTLSIVLFQTAQ